LKRRLVVAFALAVAAGSCAHGGAPGHFLSISGRCDRLVFNGVDVSAGCHSSVNRVTDGMGRSSFEFLQTRGQMLTFSGTAVTRRGNVIRQRVDQVTLATPTSHGPIFASSWRATGSCEWTDPFSGTPGHVRCSARTGETAFAGSLATSGEAPTIYR
jgi:hypothetical protein